MNIFHKLIGLVFGLCSVGALYVLDAAPKYVQTQGYLLNTQSIFTKIPIWLPALIIICVWGIFAYFLWKYVEKIFDVSVYTFSLIAYLMVSITGLYLISDHASQRLFILLLTFIVFGFIYGMIHLEKGYSTHQIKSYRRVAMMLWAFVVYCLSSFFYALSVFFQEVPFWVLAIVLALLLSQHMFYVLKMYIGITFRQSIFWLSIIGVFMFEIIWVVQLLPFAYSTLGFFVAWLWYIIQLLLRFHFSNKDIDWKNQRTFLLTNLLLFVTLLLLSTWR